ncbi:hypothetical protein ACVBEQ_02755 [Nakamurella sp. GG22]
MGHADAQAENVDAVLGSETVDAQFWALVCDDEEWLRAEFDGIVSEAAELRTPPPARVTVSDAPDGGRSGAAAQGTRRTRTPPWGRQVPPGRAWRRQRGPPALPLQHC